MSRQPPPGQLPGQLNIFQAAESMGAAEALRQAAQALQTAADTLGRASCFAADIANTSAADMHAAALADAPEAIHAWMNAAAAARTAANAARQEANR